MNERVVITGIGFVIPNGIGIDKPWQHVLSGQSAIGRITRFDPSIFTSQVAGEVRDFSIEPYLDNPRKARELDRFTQFAIAAAKIAIQDADLGLKDEERETSGVILGVGFGGLSTIESSHTSLLQKGPNRVTPYFVPASIASIAAGQVSIHCKLKGPNFVVTSACASGTHSIGEAARYIRAGMADVMLAGGAEAGVTPLGISGFTAMMALSKRNDPTASRPWDRTRDGFVIGEGSAVLVLESLSRARARGAKIYAELTGYGASSDAYHVTSPSPDGDGALRAMKVALHEAKLNPEQIDYINAHGTATQQGDLHEIKAIRACFGSHAHSGLKISSTKSSMGHLLGAAGAAEAAICALALQHQVAPPTLHLNDCDDTFKDLDLIPWHARPMSMQHALSNSFGFGGTNASLVLSKYA